MAKSINDVLAVNSLVKVSNKLYIKGFIDTEPMASSKNYEFYERAARSLEKSCEEAVKQIFLATNALPKTGDRVANSTDPCLIVSTRFEVYADAVLAWFEFQQNG